MNSPDVLVLILVALVWWGAVQLRKVTRDFYDRFY
jgi:hypothetical protein